MLTCNSAYVTTSVDGSPEGSTLHFDQSFALKTTSGFARGVSENTHIYIYDYIIKILKQRLSVVEVHPTVSSHGVDVVCRENSCVISSVVLRGAL